MLNILFYTVKPINFMQSIIPIWSKHDLTKTMMFVVKITDFPYKLSFTQ